MRRSFGTLALAGLVLLGLSATLQAQTTTITWTAGDGDWMTASNWDLGRVPQAGDDVVIDRPGDLTITYYNVAGTVEIDSLVCKESLVISHGGLAILNDSSVDGGLTLAGSLVHSGELTVGGLFRWEGNGKLNGSGRLVAQGGMEIAGTGYKYLRNGVLENSGEAVVTAPATAVTGEGGAIFRNLPSGTVTFQNDDPDLLQRFWGAPSACTFENLGTVRKEGAGPAAIHFSLANDGTIDAAAGSLAIRGGGTGTGGFTSAAGTVLEFGSVSLAPPIEGGSMAAGGDVRFVRGLAEFTGPFTVAGETYVQAELRIPGGSTVGLTLVGALLTCPGNLTVTGTLVWDSGTLTGGGRTIAAGGVEIRTSADKWLDDHTLENRATMTWLDPGALYVRYGAVLENSAKGTLLFTNDTEEVESIHLYGGTALVINLGTVRKVGSGTSRINATFDHQGFVDVQEGTLQLAREGSGPGSFTGLAGGVIEFTVATAPGLSQDYSGCTGIDTAGVVRLGPGPVTIGGVYRADGGTVVQGHWTTATIQGGTTGSLNMNGGTFICEGDLQVAGAVTWTAGKMAGAGSTVAESISIEGGATRFLDGRTLVNPVSAVWSGQCSVILANGAVIDNLADAAFLCEGDGVQGFSSSSTGVFNNHGTLTKRGSGAMYLSTNLNHQGDLVLEEGELHINVAGSGPGTFTASAGTVLEISGAAGGWTQDYSSGPGIDSDGDVQFKAGNVLVGAAYRVAGETLVDGHVTFVTLPGGSSTGSLHMKHGMIRTDGDLTVSGPFTWDLGQLGGTGRTIAQDGIEIGSIFEVRIMEGHTVQNASTAVMSGPAVMRIYPDSAFHNLAGGVFVARCDAGEVQNALGARFVNSGTFRKEGEGRTVMALTDFPSSGTIGVIGGTLEVTHGFSTAGDVTVASGATLSRSGVYTQTAGSTTVGGTLAATGIVDVQGGVLSGTGTVDASVVNGGVVRPGGIDAAGALTVTGDYSGAGAVDIEIADGAHDQLSIGSSAALGAGTLNLLTLGGFVPVTGATFLVMPYSLHEGEFATVNGTQITAVKKFLLDYEAGGLTLTVEGDETPPVFGAVTADPDTLWPPDHKMMEVTVTFEVTDDSEDPVTLAVEVASSEGENSHEPDFEVASVDQATGTIVLNLRAERDGTAPGRIYTITVTATDSSGNAATAGVTVLVPHDQG